MNRKIVLKLLALVACMMCSISAAAAEAYACYTPSNTTLTFYYDNLRSSRTGSTYDLNTGTNEPSWKSNGVNPSVTKVVFNSSFAGARPTSTYYWFYEMKNLTSITGLQYLNTSSVTDMSYMFYNCYKLTNLDVSHFNTSNVRMMSGMFMYCNGLTSLDVSNFNTSFVTDMRGMFQGCYNLPSLDVSNFYTGNVTNMDRMFLGCKMATLDLSNFNTYYVTSMESMFLSSEITSLDLSSFNTSNVKSMRFMFGECSLTSLNLGSFNTSSVTNMYGMFKDSPDLETIYVGSGWSTAAVTVSNNMFENCFALVGGQGTIFDSDHMDKAYAHIDDGPSNPGYFTDVAPVAYACYTPSNTTLTFYYDNQRSLRTGTTYDLNGALPAWYSDGTYSDVARVVFDSSFADARPTSTFRWFNEMSNLTTISGISNLKTDDVRNMAYMFNGCSSLTSLNLSGFNTANATDMSDMFHDCTSLTSLDLSSFNTANVTKMYGMFYDCSGLVSLNLSSFNTASVTNMSAMFNGCSSLLNFDLSSFNTANVKDISFMFKGCSTLTSLDVSNFNTAKATSMMGMFQDCSSLTFLDLSNFNTANVTSMTYMFMGSNALSTIFVGPNWNTAAVVSSDYMFQDCTRLVGGKGTTYNASHVDKAYAHIDGGTSNPGYLTDSNGQVAYACYTPSNTTLTFYFDDQRSSRPGTIYTDLNSFAPLWYTDHTCSAVRTVVFDPSFASARPTSTSSWFHDMTRLEDITGMEYLNTSLVTDMRTMFGNCTSLWSVDLSHFNTANVTNMSSMFWRCYSLTSLDLSSFNTANVTQMISMFEDCESLTSLNLGSFNTANVTEAFSMFQNCSSLTELDLSSFNTAQMAFIDNMFNGCSSLTTIYAGGEWNLDYAIVSDDMFLDCTSLVGGKGTSYSASHVDKGYARIDGGPSAPGYLTGSAVPEAYACYTPSNTTLTFYYDTQRSTRTGTTYDLNTGNSKPGWYRDGTNANVTKAVINSSFADARPTSTAYWFSGMTNLPSITGISYLNTENVTSMHSMFYNSPGLTSIDVSHFNTANVIYMTSIFQGCTGLTSIDVSNFNTANVIYMGGMFNSCPGLTSLDLSSFNTANVTDIYTMFSGCSSLSSLDLSSFNTANMTSMFGAFRNCTSLTSLDLSSFNTAKVTQMNQMFQGCSALRTIYVGKRWNTDAVTTSPNMFQGCTSLVGGKGTTYDASHVDKTYARIDFGPSRPGYLTYFEPAEIYAEYTPSNTTLTLYYDNLRTFHTGATYTLRQWGYWQSETITDVIIDPSMADARPTSTQSWFAELYEITTIQGLNYLNTSQVTDMSAMFAECQGLTSLDVSNFNTANVTDMRGMFGGCESLTSLDVSNFNTAKVTDMALMFDGCSGLTSLDVSHFNTAKVTEMTYLFQGCIGLTTLDLRNWNTSNVYSMWGMFMSCTGLTSLDLSSFNTPNVTITRDMFNNCSNLKTIYVGSGWSTAQVDDAAGMFYGCTSLVGGKGTTYDYDHTEEDYAHIDGGPSNPGYFTDINATPEPEAYACYTPSNTTLTFYYDTERSTREGTTYDMNVGMASPGWDDDNNYTSVTHVVFDPSFADARPVSTCSWFWGMTNLQSITGMDCMNTEDVTTMWGMFTSCSSLTTLDLSSFNTSRVTNMLAMFSDCSNLTTIYAGEGWSMATVSVSANMFTNCTKLVGGKGTTYDPNHTNGYYARIDGGSSRPGYFTEKNAFERGDVNGNGQVNISDVTALINYLLSHDASGINLQAADTNQNGSVNISDATALINFLLSGQWP